MTAILAFLTSLATTIPALESLIKPLITMLTKTPAQQAQTTASSGQAEQEAIDKTGRPSA